MSLRHRARPRKLNPKAVLQCFRFDQVNIDLEDDSARLTEIDNGVDKGEREEYHLQQAIKAAQSTTAEANKLKDAYIPTPPIINSNVDYDDLYHKGWRQPTSYIRSSSTVEDCAGTPYDMDEEDEIALKQINLQLPKGVEECSEAHFEEVIAFFEETAQNKQPFAAVDSPPVLPLVELEEQYDNTIPAHVRIYAKFVYEHWKARRTSTGNRPIAAQLKGETGADTDEADPYVCFRRREARQVRKTRNRDAHSAEKLRTLRRQLEDARNLLLLVRTRETHRKSVLENDVKLFKQRAEVKDTKRKLGIKGDDEDLVNQKKRKEVHGVSPGQAQQLAQMRSLIGRGPADELRSLEAVQENRDREIHREIHLNVEKHINWNKGYVDKTRAPLTPDSEKTLVDRSKDYRKAMPVQIPLPTPPASVSDGEMENMNGDMIDGEPTPRTHNSKTPVEPSIRYSSPDPNGPPAASFRTRIGRGGRVVVDRRLPLPFRDRNQPTHRPARNKFDSDEEDIDDVVSDDDLDSKFDRCMTQRSFLFGKAQNPNPPRQIEGVGGNPHLSGSHRSPAQVNGVQHSTVTVAPAGA